MRIAVVAFGNNEDGCITYRLLTSLDADRLDSDVCLIEGGTDVLKTLETLTGFDGIVILDTASSGEAVGAARIIDYNEFLFSTSPAPLSLHNIQSDHLFYAHKFLNIPRVLLVAIEVPPPGSSGKEVSIDIEKCSEIVRTAMSRLAT